MDNMYETITKFASMMLGGAQRRNENPLIAAAPRKTEQFTYNAPRSNTDIPTSLVSLVSHAHGRQRREERGIEKRQLQEAIKYGRKERANPGRDGKQRWRYTHKVSWRQPPPVLFFPVLYS